MFGSEQVASSMDVDYSVLAEEGQLISESLTVDGILQKWVGELGRAQWRHFALSSLAWSLEALHTLVMVFVDDQKPAGDVRGLKSSCQSWWTCSSIVQAFGLQGYKVGLSQGCFFLGALIGAGLFGNLSDGRLGRKGALFLAVLLSGLAGLLTAIAPNFWVYVLLRLTTGAASAGGMGVVSFVLATECVGPKYRGVVGMSTLYFFSLGTLSLVGLSKMVPGSWRFLYLLSSLPSVAYALMVIPFLYESPRWLIIRGRRSEAAEVLRNMATSNKRSLPPGVEVVADAESKSDDCAASGSIRDVFREPGLRYRMLLITALWFVGSLVYYGVSLNVSNLGFDLHTSVLLNALMEMPAFALTAFLLGKIGRRAMLVSSLMWSGVFCTAGSVIYSSFISLPPSISKGMLGACFGAAGMFGVAAAYNLLYIYSVELFPTVVRNAALGVASQAGNIGAIAAPIIVQLAILHPVAPFTIFAVACIAGALFGACLPETLDKPLLETLESFKAEEKNLLRESLLRNSL